MCLAVYHAEEVAFASAGMSPGAAGESARATLLRINSVDGALEIVQHADCILVHEWQELHHQDGA
jgi:hypothetical protein